MVASQSLPLAGQKIQTLHKNGRKGTPMFSLTEILENTLEIIIMKRSITDREL